MFFQDWTGIVRTLIVVTVAPGSTLATIPLSADVALAEGATALGLLAVRQLAVAWTSVRSRTARGLAKSRPTMLLREGRLLPDALRAQRVTDGEVRQAVRAEGIGGLDKVAAVVLETDGSFSVIPRSSKGSGTALADAR